MSDTETGEVTEKALKHETETVRKFYEALPGSVQVGIEPTEPMPWFLKLIANGLHLRHSRLNVRFGVAERSRELNLGGQDACFANQR